MSVHNYAATSGTIFLLVAVLHLLRVAVQWTLFIGPYEFPMWASIVAVAVAGFLSFAGFRLAQAQRISWFR